MIQIYTPKTSPRLAWICDVIFNIHLGVGVNITDQLAVFNSAQGCRINYSNEVVGSSLQIPPSQLLFEKGVKQQNIDYHPEGHKIFTSKGDLGFDIFAASFYLLSRYEEYLPHEKDKHGRYAFKNSLAAKHNFIDQPVADLWILLLKKELLKLDPTLTFKKQKYTHMTTMDVDVAYAYKGRFAWRNIRSLAKDVLTFRFGRIKDKIYAWSGGSDPYDSYQYYMESLASKDITAHMFFLLGDYGPFDKNLHHEHPTLKSLVKKHAFIAGSHPSYTANTDGEKMKMEKLRLEELIDYSVRKSRFHYLKFSLPRSFRLLIDNGYEADYSLCYPEVPGFRAGTCHPYSFYDLEGEKATALKIYPTTVMDATLRDYQKLDLQSATKTITSLMETVKTVNGTFISIWHNDSLSDFGVWKGWRSVFEAEISQAQ